MRADEDGREALPSKKQDDSGFGLLGDRGRCGCVIVFLH
jgi:hypothetical protein